MVRRRFDQTRPGSLWLIAEGNGSLSAVFYRNVPRGGIVGAAVHSALLFISALLFMLCIAQLGPALVLIPAVIWMYSSGSAAAATLLLVLSVIAIGIDNVLRPILIRRGVDLPLLLILSGVSAD